MAVAIPIMMGVSAGMSALGAVKKGQAAQAAGNYNAAIGRQNAEIANQQSGVALYQQNVQSQKVLGNMRAQFGASGLDGNEGSALDVLGASAAQSSLDAANIKYNYALKALGYNESANLAEFEGRQAKSDSYYSAAGSLLKGGASIAAYGHGSKDDFGSEG